MATVDRNSDAKEFATLQAQYALAGHQLQRTEVINGQATYFASSWGMVRCLPSLDAAKQFLQQIGGTT